MRHRDQLQDNAADEKLSRRWHRPCPSVRILVFAPTVKCSLFVLCKGSCVRAKFVQEVRLGSIIVRKRNRI